MGVGCIEEYIASNNSCKENYLESLHDFFFSSDAGLIIMVCLMFSLSMELLVVAVIHMHSSNFCAARGLL